MRIRIFNAFASNNSGSYTIVGRFPSDEVASDAARELEELMLAHTRWLSPEDGAASSQGESPLDVFVQKHGLRGYEGMGRDEEWPQYGINDNNVPQAFAVGNKVIIHHDYTVTLPRAFGEYFFARGGRVEHELNHAHHPVVGVFELYVPWQKRSGVDVAVTVRAVLEELHAPDGPLRTHGSRKHRPAWRTAENLEGPDLTVGAVFVDLLAGFTGVHRVAKDHGMDAFVKVFEAWGEGDPLAFLRPCTPPLATKDFEVLVEETGAAPASVLAHVTAGFDFDEAFAKTTLASLPAVVAWGLSKPEAEELAESLRGVGARVSVR